MMAIFMLLFYNKNAQNYIEKNKMELDAQSYFELLSMQTDLDQIILNNFDLNLHSNRYGIDIGSYGVLKNVRFLDVQKDTVVISYGLMGRQQVAKSHLFINSFNNTRLRVSGHSAFSGFLYSNSKSFEFSNFKDKGFNSTTFNPIVLGVDAFKYFNIKTNFFYSVNNDVRSVMDNSPYNNSFIANVVFVQCKQQINHSYFGNIVLFSRSPLFIPKDVQLENCIVCAPKVEIESGFKGSIQVFSQNIILQDHIMLSHPSFLVCNPDVSSFVTLGAENVI